VLTGRELQPARQWRAAGVVGHPGMALVPSVVMKMAIVTTASGGLVVGSLVWIEFIVTLEFGELIWEKIPVRLFLMRTGEHFVALGLAGIILAVWR
jgi:hypothetical protein